MPEIPRPANSIGMLCAPVQSALPTPKNSRDSCLKKGKSAGRTEDEGGEYSRGPVTTKDIRNASVYGQENGGCEDVRSPDPRLEIKTIKCRGDLRLGGCYDSIVESLKKKLGLEDALFGLERGKTDLKENGKKQGGDELEAHCPGSRATRRSIWKRVAHRWRGWAVGYSRQPWRGDL